MIESSEPVLSFSLEQKRVIETWGQGIAVLAGAGSGKTTTLVEKCVELLRRDPQARFAAVSFTERSAHDLKAKLAQKLPLLWNSGDLGSNAGHWVMTIHSLCGTILRENPREAGFEGEEKVVAGAEAELIWERALEALWFEELPHDVQASLERLLDRETQGSLAALLGRMRSLRSFGAAEWLLKSGEADSLALVTVSNFVFSRFDRTKRRKGVLDFDDLERGADQALEHQKVRDLYRSRFDMVLVDEFQDTNPVQARIVWKFCRPDLSNLCVVGDPKQSIYRFRDADVSAFEDFSARLSVQIPLTRNFRSRPKIIEFVNQLCDPLFASSSLKYDALTPMREEAPGSGVHRLNVTNPSDLGVWIQSEVARGVPLHEMALLLRKIRGNEVWLKALTSSGIPIALGSGGFFWEDPRVHELVALLKWWDNPGNSLSGATFLRAPWVGIADSELDLWVKRDPTLISSFFESSHPMAQVLGNFRNRSVRPGELLLALLISQEIEDELGSQFLGLWHRVEELSTRGLDFHSVVLELSRAVKQSRREREVPPPRNEGLLSVLTLHSAKGLEFPHVILLDFAGKNRASDAPLLFWDRVQGAYLGGRTPEGERDRDPPIEAGWREREKQKDLAESKRVFYVALTRARERLILVCPELAPELTENSRKKPVQSPDEAYAQDHWRAWIDWGGVGQLETLQFDPASLDRASVSSETNPLSPRSELEERGRQRPRLSSSKIVRSRHSVTEWNLLSRCPRAYEWTYIRPQEIEEEGISQIGLFFGDTHPKLAEKELTQMELGTLVHACLERGDYEALRRLEQEVGVARFSAEPVVSWALSSDWMAPPSEGREVWTELPFELKVGGEVLVGSMDRLICTKIPNETHFTLIDFKVTEKPKSVEALLEAYQTQMELYAFALERLDSSAQEIGSISPLLVNISGPTIQVVPVRVRNLGVEEISRIASQIVAGESGKPRPGYLCRHCDFRLQCPEGRLAVSSS